MITWLLHCLLDWQLMKESWHLFKNDILISAFHWCVKHT